jgi:hypothetical protein
MDLWIELLLLNLAAFAIGLAVAWAIWGRKEA